MGLRTGEAYDEVTVTALRTAKAVVVLWSKKSVHFRAPLTPPGPTARRDWALGRTGFPGLSQVFPAWPSIVIPM
jgi:hypothetical protein